MTSIYLELGQRIKGETVDLDHAVNRALQAWERVIKTRVYQDIYLDSVALNLHSFYSGLERMFELIAKHIDQNMPSSERWHRDLLQSMSHDVTGIRPSVISLDSERRLHSFRRFRHLVRNVYAANLMPEKIEGLVENLPVLWSKLQNELIAFANFLEHLEKGE